MNTQSYPSRRKFIQQSGLLLTSALLPMPNYSFYASYKYKLGIQLFTIRDAMAKGPLATLTTVRALGYEDGEIYGFDADNVAYYGIQAKEFKKAIVDLDFTVSSGHYDFSSYFLKSEEEMKRYVDQCIEGSLTIGAKYITWPWLAPEYRSIENFKVLSGKLNHIGEQVNQAGLGFAYHNHDFEFTDHKGQIGYDIILAETDPQFVKLQMDMYWVVKSSAKSPAQWIAENPGRFVMWHIKDMDKVSGDYSEMGNGSIDYVSMLATLDKDVLEYYYIEQGGNFKENSMQSITDSAAYVKAHLKKYLE